MEGVYIASGADDSYEPEVGHETNDRKHGKKDTLGGKNHNWDDLEK